MHPVRYLIDDREPDSSIFSKRAPYFFASLRLRGGFFNSHREDAKPQRQAGFAQPSSRYCNRLVDCVDLVTPFFASRRGVSTMREGDTKTW